MHENCYPLIWYELNHFDRKAGTTSIAIQETVFTLLFLKSSVSDHTIRGRPKSLRRGSLFRVVLTQITNILVLWKMCLKQTVVSFVRDDSSSSSGTPSLKRGAWWLGLFRFLRSVSQTIQYDPTVKDSVVSVVIAKYAGGGQENLKSRSSGYITEPCNRVTRFQFYRNSRPSASLSWGMGRKNTWEPGCHSALLKQCF